MKYTDIVWDFDGTLFDSYPNMVRSLREALEYYGFTAPDAEIHEKMTITVGHAVRFYAEKYHLDPEELSTKRKELEGFRPELVTPYPGVTETLKKIKESGRRNHLFTNRGLASVHYLEANDLLQYFDGLITAECLQELKPSPDGLLQLLKQYGCPPEKMLMVGDRVVDIDSAKNAGTKACFYNTNGIAVPEGTDFEIRKPTDLLAHL